MKFTAPSSEKLIRMVRLLARAFSVLLFLLWGAFFVEHLAWFTKSGQWPPAFVWIQQAAHLMLLVSYLVSLKWERAGSLMILLMALAFFAPIAGDRFIQLYAISIVPACLFLFCQWWEHRHKVLTPKSPVV